MDINNEYVEKLAATDCTLLITGPTGTGKSHLAQTIHRKSPRKLNRFVAINLACLNENIIESELFGHERGAFSGAEYKRVGKLEIASGGTVFLDEVGELSLKAQTKLLEILNSKMVSPVGSNREFPIDIRIIAATNRHLETMVKTGAFREDLFFRLNTFQIKLHALSDKKSMVSKFLAEFIHEFCHKHNKTDIVISECFKKHIMEYSWPGNIRELRNAVEFAIALNSTKQLTKLSLPPYILQCIRNHQPIELAPKVTIKYDFPINYVESKTKFEKEYLEEMLKKFDGRINETVRNTKIAKVTLLEKIRRHNIDIENIKFNNYLENRSLHT